jgi:hypothetical protein
MKKYIFILTLSILTISCTQNNKPAEIQFKEFPQKYNLVGIKALTKHDFRLIYFGIYDSLLVVNHPHDKEYFIHILNKTNYKPIKSVCKRGRGPNELYDSESFYIDKNEGKFGIAIDPKTGINEYSISKIVNNNYNLPVNNYSWPSQIKFLSGLKKRSNKLFSCSRNLSKKVFISFFNTEGKLIDSLDINNNTKHLKTINKKYRTHAKYVYGFHPKQEKLAISLRYSDVLIALESNGKKIFETQGPDNIKRNPKESVMKRIVTYGQIETDDNFIYCLYNGEVFMQGQSFNYSNHMHIFNWKGEPIAKITFEHAVSRYALDKENNRIVTFSPEIGDIVYYNFSFNENL